ncbi:MAG: hypothetical protein ACRDSJ_01900 [Rubrobacteraceae bacterium]
MRRGGLYDGEHGSGQVAGTAAVKARRVSDADFDPLLLRRVVAELLQPARSARPSPTRIHHEVGM